MKCQENSRFFLILDASGGYKWIFDASAGFCDHGCFRLSAPRQICCLSSILQQPKMLKPSLVPVGQLHILHIS